MRKLNLIFMAFISLIVISSCFSTDTTDIKDDSAILNQNTPTVQPTVKDMPANTPTPSVSNPVFPTPIPSPQTIEDNSTVESQDTDIHGMMGSASDYIIEIETEDTQPTDQPADTDVDTSASSESEPEADKPAEEAEPDISEEVVEFPPTVGTIAPVFQLPSVQHGDISLADYRQQNKPVVLIFYRAYWCSACRKQLDEISEHYDDFKAVNSEVIAVSTDNLDNTRNLIARQGYEFPLLYSSKDNSVPESYDRYNKFGDGLASASIFIIGTDGRIVWQDLGRNPYHFVRSSKIIGQIKDL